MSALAQALSVNILLRFSSQVALWITIHMLLFFQMDFCVNCTTLDNFVSIKEVCREHGLGSILKLMIMSDYIWTF